MSLLTLGVRDLGVARQFYVDGLGWAPAFEVEAEVCFIKVGPGLLLGLWSRGALSAEAGGLYAGDEPAPITLAHLVPDAESVTRVLDDTRMGWGDRILRRPALGLPAGSARDGLRAEWLRRCRPAEDRCWSHGGCCSA